jgi:hypothetical protein
MLDVGLSVEDGLEEDWTLGDAIGVVVCREDGLVLGRPLREAIVVVIGEEDGLEEG